MATKESQSQLGAYPDPDFQIGQHEPVNVSTIEELEILTELYRSAHGLSVEPQTHPTTPVK